MTDKYANLPGHLTQFKDGGLQLVQEANPPKTESVLILGTALDGPVMEPVKVDASTMEAVFGKGADDKGIPNGSTLTVAFEEAYNAGCRDIRLMRVSGKEASAKVVGSPITRTEEKIHEGILGYAQGNDEAQSAVVLSSKAKAVVKVEADGVTLLESRDYIVGEKEVDDKYIDKKTEILYDFAEVHKIEFTSVAGVDKVVEVLAESIWGHVSEPGRIVWEKDIPFGEQESFEPFAEAGIDKGIKGEIDAAKAYIAGTKEGVATIMSGCAIVGDIVVYKAKMTQISITSGACNAGALLKVTYTTKEGTTKVETTSRYTPVFIANGTPLEFKLEQERIPSVGATLVYIDGVEYNENDTLVEDSSKKVFQVVKETGQLLDQSIYKAKIVLNAGKHAKRGAKVETRFAYIESVTVTPEFRLETAFGGEVYNQTQYLVDKVAHTSGVVETVVSIIKPRAKRAQANEEALKYSSFDCPTLGLLVRAINNDANNNGFVKAFVNDKMADIDTDLLEAQPAAINFEHGDNGINVSKQDLFTKLSGKKDADGYLLETGAYQLLENYTVDYIVPAGVYSDDKLLGKFDNFAYELALFCAVVSHLNHATIGVIATSSPTEPTLKAVEAHVEKLMAEPNVYYMRDTKGEIIRDTDNNAIDLGKYINVLAGGDMVLYNQRIGQYTANSAAAFAGFLSQLAVNSAPTNKVLNFVQGLRIKYSNSQLDKLTGNRYITLKYKGDGNTVAIVDSMTASAPGSDYERTATMRAVRELANEIREVADPFLGEPNTPEQRNALSSLIDKRLEQHKDAGTMRDYSFQLKATAYDELVGQATIELTVVPAQELRKITTIISLKPSI